MESLNFQDKIFVIILSVSLGTSIWFLGGTVFLGYKWLGVLICLISLLYFPEMIRWRKGKEIFWEKIKTKDKIIFFLDLIVLLITFIYPVKDNLNIENSILSILIGLLATATITYIFGSKKIKERFFGF